MRIVAVDDLRRGLGAALFEGADHGSPVAFFMIDFPPGEGPRTHRHPYAETFLVHEGEATFTVEGGDAVVAAGHFVVAPAGAAHRFVNTGAGALRLTSIAPVDRVVQEDVETG